MPKKTLKGVSALALLFGATGLAPAFAQQSTSPQTVTPSAQAQTTEAPSTGVVQTPAAPTSSQGDKVVITGSLIATAREDSPKPVEVFTAADIEAQGSPTVTEFIRSLTASYGDDLGFGQAAPETPQGTGFGNANLRGQGSNGTLVLMNGRRMAPWNGSFGADVNGIPMEALEAVEVLKDGASATYGAGAVGGVINFRTRRDINAPQFTIERQLYDGSDGAYKIDFLTGWSGRDSNVLMSLSYRHEDSMLQTARGFSNLPFDVNPAQYTLTGSNPGIFQPVTSNFLTHTGAQVAGFPGIQDYRNAGDCTALGGQITNVMQPGALNSGFPNTSCAFSQSYFQDLVSENDTYRGYLEFNNNLSDTMEFHFDVTYTKSDTIQRRVPIDPALSSAIDRRSLSAAVPGGWISNTCGGCNLVIPVQVHAYNASNGTVQPNNFTRNPFIDDFIARTGTSAAALPNHGALYTNNHWRPFLWGGWPLTDDGLRHDRFERDTFITNFGLKGEFAGDGFLGRMLNGVQYDYSIQYNQYLNTYHQPDIFTSRLQNALLGYGGPNCNAIDRVPTDYSSPAAYNRTVGIQSETRPGTGGCQWFNPFASSFPTSVANNAANPQFNAGTPNLGAGATPRPSGYQNPRDLMDWMIGNKTAEYKLESVTFDGLWSGEVPDSLFTLPGGNIGWAVGTQWRQVEGRASHRDPTEIEEMMGTQPCVWPDLAVVEQPAQPAQRVGMGGCTNAAVGAFWGSGRVNIVTQIPPFYYDTQSIAYLAEFQFPVLDNVNLSLSLRREDYNGGDLIGDIYSVAGKWDITDNLYVRTSYGTNYRADNALELAPGTQSVATVTQNRFGTGFLTQESITVADGIGPEDDTTFNFGVGYQRNIGDGRLRASVDFFEIIIDGQVATTSATTVLNNVFGLNTAAAQSNRGIAGIPNTATTGSAGQFADCNARLISFVAFTSPCVQGVTTAADILEVLRFQLNGPGFATNGIDYAFDYVHPLFDGNIAFNLSATQNLVYKARGYSVNGILFDQGGHRLGYDNLTRTGSLSVRWKANATVRWSNQRHNINLRANYSSGTYNEANDQGGLTPIIITPANQPNVFSPYGVFLDDYLDFDVNYIYTAPFWEHLQFRASVLNITDEDPMAAQRRNGYYGGIGNPRGRMLELAVTKKF